MSINDIYITIIIGFGIYLGSNLYKYILKPWFIEKCTTDVEKNPKWITEKLRKEYYGLHDIDFILVNCTFGPLPRFRLSKKENRLQLLLPEDTSTKDVNDLARVALVAKIKIKYGLWFPEKPVYWLSILCYMLEGGDINESATKWEDKKPLDLSE